MSAQWAAAIGSGLLALASIIVAIITRAETSKARAKQADAALAAAQVDGRRDALVGYEQLVADLRAEVDRLARAQREDRKRIEELELDGVRDRRRIEDLERSERITQRWVAGARRHIRDLYETIRAGGHELPPPPPGWSFDPDD